MHKPAWFAILKVAFDHATARLAPEQQAALRKGLIIVGSLLVLLGGGTSFIFATGYANIFDKSPVPGATTQPVVVVAREPGPSYNVEAFCKDPSTVVLKQPMTDAPAGGTRYVASRGTEQINWPDSPPDMNPSAMHYWHDTLGVQHSEGVEVTRDAARCLKAKAK